MGTVGKCGTTISSPSTAEATEIGGVMIPSASKVPAPMIAGMYNHFRYRLTNANKENMPPSPRLSACKVSIIYLKVVCKVSVQKTQDIPPYTKASVIALLPMMELITYNGEVPISPYIIPNATSKPAAVALLKFLFTFNDFFYCYSYYFTAKFDCYLIRNFNFIITRYSRDNAIIHASTNIIISNKRITVEKYFLSFICL